MPSRGSVGNPSSFNKNDETTNRQAWENSTSSNNKTVIATNNLIVNNLPTIETLTSEDPDPATHSHKHPEFDCMIMNNEFGKMLRKARWELY